MRICIVSSTIPPSYSGAGLVAYRYASRLNKKGTLAFILTRTPFNAKKDINEYNKCLNRKILITTKKAGYLNRNDNGIIRRIFPFSYDLIKLFIYTFIVITKYRKYFEILHCFSPDWDSFFAILIGKLYGKKIVLELTSLGRDDPDYVAPYDKLKILYQRRSIQYKLANAIICISPALVNSCIKYGIDKSVIYLVPRPVNTKVFHPPSYNEKLILRNKFNVNDNYPVLLFIGRVIERKGARIIIPILQNIYKKYPNVHLFIVGKNDSNIEEKMFKKIILDEAKMYKMDANISFVGVVSNVQEYMKASDIMFMSSTLEGLPNVVIEAMACGLPVVANMIHGITDYIIENEKDGIIVNKNQPDDYVNAIEKLAQNKKMRVYISDNAVKKVQGRFKIDLIDEKYNIVYNKLTS